MFKWTEKKRGRSCSVSTSTLEHNLTQSYIWFSSCISPETLRMSLWGKCVNLQGKLKQMIRAEGQGRASLLRLDDSSSWKSPAWNWDRWEGGGSEGYFQTVMLLKISGYGSDVAEGGESFDTFNQTAKTKKREKEIRQLPSTELKTFCL